MAGMVRKQDRNDGRMQRMPFDGCRTGVEAAVAGLVCQLQCLRAAVVLLLRHVPASEHVLWRMNLYGVLCEIVLLLFGRQSGPCDVSGEVVCVGMVLGVCLGLANAALWIAALIPAPVAWFFLLLWKLCLCTCQLVCA